MPTSCIWCSRGCFVGSTSRQIAFDETEARRVSGQPRGQETMHVHLPLRHAR
jgi:hypothetical protein